MEARLAVTCMQEIIDMLVVDLKVSALERKFIWLASFHVAPLLFDHFEQVFKGALQHAPVFLIQPIALDCMSFAGSCLPISEDAAVDSLQAVGGDRLGYNIE